MFKKHGESLKIIMPLITLLYFIINFSSHATVHDVSSFCQKTGNSIVKKKIFKTVEELDSMPYEDYESKIKLVPYDIFILFNTSSVPFSRFLFSVGLNSSLKISNQNFSTNESIHKLLDNHINWLEDNMKTASVSSVVEYIEELIFSNNKYQLKLKDLCEKIKVLDCSDQSFFRLMSILVRTNNENNVPVVDKTILLYTNQRLRQLAAFAAIGLLKKVKQIDSETKVSGNIFDDIVDILKAKNVSKKEAEEFAWLFLGVYGTRGATFSVSGIPEKSKKTSTNVGVVRMSLHVLSLVISYLDKLKMNQSGQSYAFPNYLKTSCLYGKPYRFWMSAYLAKYGVEQGFSEKQSFAGSYLLGIGYDMSTSYNGRDPSTVYTTPINSDFNRSRRIDAIWEMIGSHVGSRGGVFKNNYDLDRGIGKTLEGSSAPNPLILNLKDENLKFVLSYLSVVNPQIMIGDLWRFR